MMQRNYGFVCWVLITFIFCLTTPCKAVDKNKLNIRPFHKLEVKGDVEVEIIQSDQCGILIVAQDNYRDLVDIEQNDNVLTISMDTSKKVIFYTTGTNKVVVYTDDFKKLRVSGESDVRIPKPFYFKDSFSLEKKGSGDFDGIIKVDDFKLNVKGSGSLDTAVKCLNFDLEFSGSGNHRIQITDALKGKIITSGSGNVNADIFSKMLDSNKSGSGELHLDLLTKKHTLN
ncbi:MAG: GIN domain-containing protein, partial [Prolixibacteraceae bacterium]